MKEKEIIKLLIIFTLGIFSGYLIFNNNSGEINSTIIDTNKISFEKREKCANYRDKAQEQLEETYKMATPYFYDIFYSPKIDSCIYTHGLLLAGISPNEIGNFKIVDYFSGETIFSVGYDNSSENEEDYSYIKRPIFSEEVDKYRNE